MEPEPLLHQKKVRTMGTILIIVSSLGALSSLALIPFAVFSSLLLSQAIVTEHDLAEWALDDQELSLSELSDSDLREALSETFEGQPMLMPDDTTVEQMVETSIYLLRKANGDELPLPADPVEELMSPASILLPDGVTSETTIGELMQRDFDFFKEHSLTFRLLTIGISAFYVLISLIFLRLAIEWRKGDPFGKVTIIGLRWLGVIFLLQFVLSQFLPFLVPESELSYLFLFSHLYDMPVDAFLTGGAPLSCGILFLILSWVLDHGNKMKEEQALTI